MILGFKDIEIRKLDFVAKTQIRKLFIYYIKSCRSIIEY